MGKRSDIHKQDRRDETNDEKVTVERKINQHCNSSFELKEKNDVMGKNRMTSQEEKRNDVTGKRKPPWRRTAHRQQRSKTPREIGREQLNIFPQKNT